MIMAGAGKFIVGGLVVLLGLIGLFLAASAKDDGIYLFGLAVAAFAVLWVFGAIKKAFDSIESAGSALQRSAK
jgi:hypothetical protein